MTPVSRPPSVADTGSYTVVCTRRILDAPGRSGQYMIDPWALASITPCRACGGPLLWAEAGYVAGYRICEQCGRSWLVSPSIPDADHVGITVSIPDTSEGPAWPWAGRLPTGDDEYADYVDEVTRFGGAPASRDVWAHHRSR